MQFTYGQDRQRTVSRFFGGNILQKYIHYVGNYEKEASSSGIRQLHYIAGGDGLAAIYEINNGTGSMYYVHSDHLGSYDAITNQSGTVVQNYSFDAWGRRRNVSDWTYRSVPTSYLFNVGYTGHEHLDQFGLINMNGRMYDPLLGRMLAPDNFVQAPGFTQSYNRYSYAFNNPLIYTDPSGEIVWVPIIIDAIIGAYTGGSTANGTYNPGDWDYQSGKTWGYIGGGALVGGLSARLAYNVATSGIAFSNTASIATGSFTNSVGMNLVTGGQTDISIGFGFGSYNFSNGELGYLGKKGNNTLENIGYGLGAMADLADINQLINSTDATLYTQDRYADGSKDNIYIS